MTEQSIDPYWFMPSEYNHALQRFVSSGIRALMEAQKGPYSLASRESINQLPDYAEPPDGEPPEGHLIDATCDASVSKDEIIRGDFEGIVVGMNRIAVELEAQISKWMIAHIEEVAKSSGNSVSGKLSYDAIINMLQSIDFSFDESGEPNLSFVAGPKIIQEIKELGQPTKEQQERFDGIIARRRDEWNARRRSRRLSARRD